MGVSTLYWSRSRAPQLDWKRPGWLEELVEGVRGDRGEEVLSKRPVSEESWGGSEVPGLPSKDEGLRGSSMGSGERVRKRLLLRVKAGSYMGG